MILIKSIIDFLIILLLVRLLIRPIETNYNQIYSLIYRITDYILKPLKSIFRDDLKSVLVSVLGLVIIRGLIYLTITRFTILAAVGVSFLNLLQLLFQFYMAVWFIAIFAGDRVHTPVISVLQRGFSTYRLSCFEAEYPAKILFHFFICFSDGFLRCRFLYPVYPYHQRTVFRFNLITAQRCRRVDPDS